MSSSRKPAHIIKQVEVDSLQVSLSIKGADVVK